MAKSHSAEYKVWGRIVQRCTNPKHDNYARYGGRGITVASEWMGPGGFDRFILHVGPRPSADYSIERINNDGNYEPGNVRWATGKEQARNKRTNVLLTLDGRTECVAVWAKELGIDRSTILSRIRAGWTHEEALRGKAVA